MTDKKSLINVGKYLTKIKQKLVDEKPEELIKEDKKSDDEFTLGNKLPEENDLTFQTLQEQLRVKQDILEKNYIDILDNQKQKFKNEKVNEETINNPIITNKDKSNDQIKEIQMLKTKLNWMKAENDLIKTKNDNLKFTDLTYEKIIEENYASVLEENQKLKKQLSKASKEKDENNIKLKCQQRKDKMKQIIVLIGAPGSGKGTLCSKLVNDKEQFHISTGDLLRNEIEKESELGNKVKDIMHKGGLVPDDVIVGLVKAQLELFQGQKQQILDGFPRTRVQAEKLRRIVEIDLVLTIKIDPAVLVERMKGRWIHQRSGRIYHSISNPPAKPGIDDVTGEPLTQRKDDLDTHSIQNRLKEFQNNTLPLIDQFSKITFVKELDGADQEMIIYKKAINYIEK